MTIWKTLPPAQALPDCRRARLPLPTDPQHPTCHPATVAVTSLPPPGPHFSSWSDNNRQHGKKSAAQFGMEGAMSELLRSSFPPPLGWRHLRWQYHTSPWLGLTKDTALHTHAHFLFPLSPSPAGEGRCVYRRQAKHLRLKQSWWNAGCPFNLLEIIRQKIMASHTHQFPGK